MISPLLVPRSETRIPRSWFGLQMAASADHVQNITLELIADSFAGNEAPYSDAVAAILYRLQARSITRGRCIIRIIDWIGRYRVEPNLIAALRGLHDFSAVHIQLWSDYLRGGRAHYDRHHRWDESFKCFFAPFVNSLEPTLGPAKRVMLGIDNLMQPAGAHESESVQQVVFYPQVFLQSHGSG